MKVSIARQLIGINRSFYNDFARSWSTSRVTIHPGIVRVFDLMQPTGHMLDLGCGDGRVGRWARDRAELLSMESYLGADFSDELLRNAEKDDADISFVCADLCAAGWSHKIRDRRARYDSIVCFSALHHIPGHEQRLSVMREVHELLEPGGKFAVSVWQLSHVPRLQQKIVPWETVNLSQNELEANDLLVDWKMGGEGFRYVHEFSERELLRLFHDAGFHEAEAFRSDGQTGDMGLYVLGRR